MKSKTKVNFVCQECGYDSPSWLGKCPECGSWNSMKEIRISSLPVSPSGSRASFLANTLSTPKTLSEVIYTEKSRIQTAFEEFNTVLGGGIVKGAAMLIAGDPGVGKSTLLLQLALSLARGPVKSQQKTSHKVLYVSGEESVEQIKMRAERIKNQK